MRVSACGLVRLLGRTCDRDVWLRSASTLSHVVISQMKAYRVSLCDVDACKSFDVGNVTVGGIVGVSSGVGRASLCLSVVN